MQRDADAVRWLEVRSAWGECELEVAHLRPGERREIAGCRFSLVRGEAEAVFPDPAEGYLEVEGTRHERDACERKGWWKRSAAGLAACRIPPDGRLVVTLPGDGDAATGVQCIAMLTAAEPLTRDCVSARIRWMSVVATLVSLLVHGAVAVAASWFQALPLEPGEVSKDDLFEMYRYLRASTEREQQESGAVRRDRDEAAPGALSFKDAQELTASLEAVMGRWRSFQGFDWMPYYDKEVANALWSESLKESPRIPIVTFGTYVLATSDDEHELLPLPAPGLLEPRLARREWSARDFSWDHAVELPLPSATGLPPRVVQDLVRKRLGVIRLCYQQGLFLNPHLQGTLSIKLTVGSDGRVSDSSIAKSDVPDWRVSRCVRDAMYSLRFPVDGWWHASAVIRLVFVEPSYYRLRLH